MNKLSILFASMLLLSTQISASHLNCPSLSQIQQAPLIQVVAACEDGSEDCGDYAALGLLEHEGQYWIVVSGLFDEVDTYTQAKALIDKSHEPEIYSQDGQSLCLYYGISMEEGRFKAVGALPYQDFNSLSANPIK